MTPEAQRIAIAEACGWKNIRESSLGHSYYGDHADPEIGRTQVPDYLNDLNAMHEAESTLSDKEQMADYFIRVSESHASEHGLEGFDAIHATAAQRAEAFLRTLGKWTE